MAKRSLFDTGILMRRLIVYILLAAFAIIAVDAGLKLINSSSEFFVPESSLYTQRSEFDEISIPELPLNSLSIANTDPSFLLEGVFPVSPDTGFVYTIEPPKVKLNYESNAVSVAQALGFVGRSYTSLNGNTNTDLLWENSTDTRRLGYNAETLTWNMRTDYVFDTIALQPKIILEDISTYRTIAKNLISDLGLASGVGMGNARAIVHFAKLGNDSLFTNPIRPTSGSNIYVVAELQRSLPLARLLSRRDLPTLPADFILPPEFDGFVYKEDPREGSLHLVIGDNGENSARDIYELDFVDYIFRGGSLVREFITAEEAWTQVRAGQGKLRFLKPKTSDYFSDSEVLSVEKFILEASSGGVELGFFEPNRYDGFIYPVYIFKGRAELTNGLTADFVFFMDAINRNTFAFR